MHAILRYCKVIPYFLYLKAKTKNAKLSSGVKRLAYVSAVSSEGMFFCLLEEVVRVAVSDVVGLFLPSHPNYLLPKCYKKLCQKESNKNKFFE